MTNLSSEHGAIPARRDLFATPVWEVSLPLSDDQRSAMVASVDEMIARYPAPSTDPFVQCDAILHEQDVPVWREFFPRVGAVMERILAQDLPYRRRIERAFIRAWAVRIDSPDDFDRTVGVDLLHSHLPSLLTSVFYLQVPSALVGASTGGTTFRDPQSVYTRLFRPPFCHFSAEVDRLLVFPGHVEHEPERPPRDMSFDRPRVVIVTDLLVDH